jgi:uncharacterized membrane protein
MMRSAGKVFLQGLVAVLPIALTLYALGWLVTTLEATLGTLLRRILPEAWVFPGLGVVLALALIFAAGLVLRAVLARRVYDALDSVFERVPGVKTLYGMLKDLFGFLGAGREKRKLDRVVRVEVGETGIALLGFVTRESGTEITGRAEDAGSVAVYLPMSYQIGGYLALVPREKLTELEMGMEHALRTALTAGLSSGESNAALEGASPPRRRGS